MSMGIRMRSGFCHLNLCQSYHTYHVFFVFTDNSQHVLVQVNDTLDAQLVIAREENAGAQKVIAEKEEKYLKIRAEKESTLEEMKKESLVLNNEAEENSMVSFIMKEFLSPFETTCDLIRGSS